MSKRRKRIDSRQLSLFDLVKQHQEKKAGREPQTGTLSVSLQLQELLDKCIGRSPLSRELIAGKMSELVGRHITKAQLDSWTAPSKKKHRFPAEYLPAFCVAVNDSEPIDFLARKSGVFVLPGRDVLRAELARRLEQRDETTQEIKKIKLFLKEMDDG